MRSKYVILAILYILAGHTGKAAVSLPVRQSCLVDNTSCTNVYYDMVTAANEMDQVCSQMPRPSKSNFQRKFRMPSSNFTGTLFTPDSKAPAPPPVYIEGYQKQTRYLLMPFYYIFLFRFYLF